MLQSVGRDLSGIACDFTYLITRKNFHFCLGSIIAKNHIEKYDVKKKKKIFPFIWVASGLFEDFDFCKNLIRLKKVLFFVDFAKLIVFADKPKSYFLVMFS